MHKILLTSRSIAHQINRVIHKNIYMGQLQRKQRYCYSSAYYG